MGGNFLKILAIESSCDDTSVAVVEDGRKVLSCKTSSQIDIHKVYGGVVPEVASRAHIESVVPLTRLAMEESQLEFKDIDAVGATYAPGLIGSLLVGLNFAKGISIAVELPLVPVHHIKAHVASLYLTNHELEPPFLCLVASGGHSHILKVEDYTKMKIIAKTRDDAPGEAFDKIGRRLGFDYPGGIKLDQIAESGNPDSFQLPIPMKEEETLDFSFSGLKTAMINIINKFEQKQAPLPIEDLSATFRKFVVNCLVKNFINAAKSLNIKTLAIAGGVSANSMLRRELQKKCAENNYRFYMPEKKYCGDNAAMVGAQAYYEFISGSTASLDLNAYASKLLLP